jgi:hypothetical protein
MLRNDRLTAIIGCEPHTPLEDAVEATLARRAATLPPKPEPTITTS